MMENTSRDSRSVRAACRDRLAASTDRVASVFRAMLGRESTDPVPERPPAEPESDEQVDASKDEQIRRLLAANDGRLRQQRVVGATDWSAPTVSRHLSALEEEGVVRRSTVGREKVVVLTEGDAGEQLEADPTPAPATPN